MYTTDKEKMKNAFKMGVAKSRSSAVAKKSALGAAAGAKLGKKIIESIKNGSVMNKENQKIMTPYYKNLKKLVK